MAQTLLIGFIETESSTPAGRLLAEFRQHPHWVRGSRLVADGAALVGLGRPNAAGTTVYWDFLLVPNTERGRGQGRAGLTWMLNLADRHGVTLRSHVGRFGSSKRGLKQSELRKWYASYGFVVRRDGSMHRPPKTPPQPYIRALAASAMTDPDYSTVVR